MKPSLWIALACTTPALAQQKDSASAAVAAAQAAAGPWLQLVDHLQYGESWDSAAALLRGAVTKAAWESEVLQARGPFEPFGERRLLSATFTRALPNAPPGEYVVLQYETKVRGNRAVTETVTPMRGPDGRWRVSGYVVAPR